MRTILALFLCGIVYASASQKCSEKEYKACNPSGVEKGEDIETEEQLEDMCRYRNTVVKCQVDYMNRCDDYPPRGKGEYIKEVYRMFGAFCDKSNPLRKKLLDNARCLNPLSKTIYDICEYTDDDTAPRDVFCKDLKRALKCFDQTIADKCGKEAREVYIFAMNPELQLRLAGCV